jgi:hypothetical protein
MRVIELRRHRHRLEAELRAIAAEWDESSLSSG